MIKWAEFCTIVVVTAALVLGVWGVVGATALRVETLARDQEISARLDQLALRVDDCTSR